METVILRGVFAAVLAPAMFTKKKWYHGLVAIL